MGQGEGGTGVHGRSRVTTRRERKPGNYIAEWFGHRVYPVVAATHQSLQDQQSQRCPFLSVVTGGTTECIKAEKSKGVCSISSISNRKRQDWLVCPFRALDEQLLDNAARRLFGHAVDADISLVPAPVLGRQERADAFRERVRGGMPSLVYFQNKLGGEISVSATERSPEFSFEPERYSKPQVSEKKNNPRAASYASR